MVLGKYGRVQGQYGREGGKKSRRPLYKTTVLMLLLHVDLYEQLHEQLYKISYSRLIHG